MEKMTTKQRILSYLRNKPWTSGMELEDLAHDWETKASTISRRARELADDKIIERSTSQRGTVQYRLPQMSATQANLFLESLRKEENVSISRA